MDNSIIGQGHGVEGRFAGLADPFADASSSIVILPIPFDKTTTYQKGTDKGPAALIEASRNVELYDIETNSTVYQKGIYTAPEINEPTSEKMMQAGYEKTKHYLKQNKFVVTLGGEHSVSFGPIKAHAEYFKQLTVLQFDAHADLQDAYERNPWSHASIMARVKEIPEVVKIVSVGIRSMSQEELANLDRKNTFFAQDLNNHPGWMDDLLELLEGPIYITFDLDAFDSALMPSTGTPEPGGFFWNEALLALKKVMQEREVVGFDVVELCPMPHNKAPDYVAAKLVYKMLSYQFARLE